MRTAYIKLANYIANYMSGQEKCAKLLPFCRGKELLSLTAVAVVPYIQAPIWRSHTHNAQNREQNDVTKRHLMMF